MRSDVKVLLAVVTVGGVLGLGAMRWINAKANDADEESKRRAERDIATSNMFADVHQAVQSPADRRLAATREVWSDFDRLSGKLRSKEMLAVHLAKANAVADNVPVAESEALLAGNAIAYRERLAKVLVAGEPGRAVGPGLTGISPSDDPARCKEIAEDWMRTGFSKELKTVGYARLVCGADSIPL